MQALQTPTKLTNAALVHGLREVEAFLEEHTAANLQATAHSIQEKAAQQASKWNAKQSKQPHSAVILDNAVADATAETEVSSGMLLFSKQQTRELERLGGLAENCNIKCWQLSLSLLSSASGLQKVHLKAW